MKLTIKVGIAFAILCGLMAIGGGFSYFNMSKIDGAFSVTVHPQGLDRQNGTIVS